MEIFVYPFEVAAGWRPLTEPESLTAEGLIDEALVLLTVKVPALETKAEGIVKLIVCRMVRRVMKNPDGYRVRNESIDDYTEGGTVDSTLSTGELYVSAEELAWLGVTEAALSPKRAFEIRPR